jgi:hypothetical protein
MIDAESPTENAPEPPVLGATIAAGKSAVSELDASALIRVWTRTTARVVAYGFAIEYGTLERPRLGTFDGLKIVLDPVVDFEMQCFLVLHLFGHSVQWVAPSLEPEIRGLAADDLESFLEALERYERSAARFGLQLMNESGVADLKDWFFDFAETDWKYVETFYRTGRLPAWEECRVRGARPIEPSQRLEPKRVEVRFAF